MTDVALTSKPPTPRVRTDEDRIAILDCFARAEFLEPTVCRRLRVPDFDALEGDGRLAYGRAFADTDAQATLIRLFVLGHPISVDDLGTLTGTARSALFATGLLAADTHGHLYSPIRLVPIADAAIEHRTLYVVSDRGDNPDNSPFLPFPDIVFSGHNPLTRQFLRLLPTTQTGVVLDLCSGTGIGAMIAEPFASTVIAVDVTERCTIFAEFNRWLNGTARVDVRQGDLYAPVEPLSFDRIIAHPPYVPALSQSLIYRDGGESGDDLLRRIVEGLPRHLARDGTFHVLSIGMDTADASYEARVRQWLGHAAPEFDIVFALGSRMSPAEFARSLVAKRPGSGPEDLERWMELFGRLSISDVVYGALVARRFNPSSGAPQTRRVFAGERTDADSFLWLLNWFTRMRRPDFAEALLGSRPILSSDSQLHVDYRVRDGRFTPQMFRLLNEGARFRVQLETDGWIVALLNALDGSRTVADVYCEARTAKSLPEGFAQQDFVQMVALMIERGFVRLPA